MKYLQVSKLGGLKWLCYGIPYMGILATKRRDTKCNFL